MNSFMFTQLDQISDQEKIKRFNEIYEYIKDSLTQMECGDRVKDFDHYCFEMVLVQTLAINPNKTKELWGYFNSIINVE